ncbi:TrkA C-terminal domain-containing protein [Methylobacterium nodulans]|uniref:PRC-barrel domain-containing protein n=1 Tax=Methylobacterium nodulans (strain LMG 21967 / CNCM I-2342 / ORS 2060) TaxID=460265 RepID=B8IHI9_METNO|nr:TrkA C-terminal domain-containing protein [Methylobacterium nodulans]ACL61652.1 conserved hypothetical protein [Methylobacterium nodulans ORS 2060]
MQRLMRDWVCAVALVATAGAADAQTDRSPLTDRADSMMQMGAASLMPALRGRWIHADHGLIVGRVREVRVSENGHTLLAVVARRRRLGGGEVAIPVPNLRQVGDTLTVSGAPDAIRALPPL